MFLEFQKIIFYRDDENKANFLRLKYLCIRESFGENSENLNG